MRFMSSRGSPLGDCLRWGRLAGFWGAMLRTWAVATGAGVCAPAGTMGTQRHSVNAVTLTILCISASLVQFAFQTYMLQSGKIRNRGALMAQDQDVSRRDFVKAAGAV